MNLKYTFFIFLLLTVISLWMMLRYQFQFEAATGLEFNVMEFELPENAEKLKGLISAWAEPE